MKLGTSLGITGIIATVFFGAWAVWVVLKKKKYPGQVTFVEDTYLPLFDAIVKNMPDLKVSFRDQAVGEGLVLLKGALLNTGSKDITPDMIAENVTMSLPVGYNWITVKLVGNSPKVECNIDIDERSLVFNMGLFRRSEYLRFEALAEVPIEQSESEDTVEDIGNKLWKAIEVNHRIADTQKVISANLLPLIPLKSLMKRLLPGVGSLVVLVATLLTFILTNGIPVDLNFKIPTESGDIVVRARYALDGTVKLKGVESKDYRKTLPVKELFKIKGMVPIIVPDKDLKLIAILLAFVIFLILLLFSIVYRDRRKAMRLRKLLGLT